MIGSSEAAICPKTLTHKTSAAATTCSSSPTRNDASMAGGRFKEFLNKYGKVGLGVHISVSAASITGLYVAIKNNVDVESIIDKWNLPGFSKPSLEQAQSSPQDGFSAGGGESAGSTVVMEEKKMNRTAELAASTGGALAMAVLCNKALFPVRVPITLALTPPVARFLARRKMIKTGS